MLRRFLARWVHRTRKPFRRQDRARPRGTFRPQLDALEERNLLSGLSLVPASSTAASSASSAYGQLPLSFEVNEGQTDSQVNYLARGQGYSIFLTPTAAVLNLQPTGTAPDEVLRMQLDGANSAASVSGLGQLPGVSNYYLGNDPSQWHLNVPNFSTVEYQNVYDGVNLDYYGNQQQLEYDFVVSPGANPGVITLDFQGADSLSLDSQGNLILHTADGALTQQAPVLYQNINGVRQAVSGSFVLEGGTRVGFQVGAYDASQPLVIDPVALSYATYLGGGLNDVGNGIALDQAGDAYIVGSTNSLNFPTQNGIQSYQGTNNTNAFVTKLNPQGTGLIFSTYLGGAVSDQGNGIAVDSQGFAYVTGTTASSNFPTTPGSLQPQFSGGTDAFVARFSPTGSLIYSTFLGGSAADQGLAIAVDSNSLAYVTGVTFSSNLPTTANAYSTTYTGGANGTAFLSVVNSAGSQLLYSSYLGGTGGDQGNAIAVDPTLGLAFVAGTTQSTDFPTTAKTAAQPAKGSTKTPNTDAFMAEINTTVSGTAGLLYSTYIGGSTNDQAHGIAVVPNVDGKGDGNDYVYVAGSTDSTDFPTTTGAVQTQIGGGQDAFVTKIAPFAGGPFLFSTYLGGLGTDSANAIAVDANGNVYVTGQTNSGNFPQSSGTLQSYGGQQDAFVSQLNSIGTVLLYSTYLGGPLNDDGLGIAVSGSMNVFSAYVTGSTGGSFPVTTGSFQTTYGGGSTDGFVAKVAGIPSPANHLVFTTQPSTTLFGAPITPAVTVAVEDQTGTIQKNDNTDQITLAIGANPGGGTLGGTVTMTVQNGVATFNNITISQPGNGYTLVASSPALSTATSTAFNIIKPTHLVFDPNGQPTNTQQGATITPPVKVDILDANNNIVMADNKDVITISIGTNPGGGTLGGTLSATAVNGVATFSNLSINQAGNGYTLVASGTGLVSATSNTFNIISNHPVPTHLAFITQPQNGAPNSPLGTFTVAVEDVNNNVVTSDNTDQITLTLGANPGSATLGGMLTMTVTNGVANFSNVTVSAVGNGYTLVATPANSSLTPATSNPFNIVAATQLSFLTQPPATLTAGSFFNPPIQVAIKDANGNILTGDNSDQVTLTLTSNGNGATLSGTTTVTAVNGVATFSNITVDQVGQGYTLTATSGSLTPAVSGPFNVTPGVAARLLITNAPGNVKSGQAFTFTITALDAFGNVSTGYGGTVTFTSSDPLAQLPADYTFQPSDAGIHTFTATLFTANFQTITATDTANPSLFDQAVINVLNTNIFNRIVTGTDAGGGPEVKVFDGTTNALIFDFFAYSATFAGGVRVAQGDVEGLGIPDIVTGPGPGGGPQINVYNGGTGQLVRSFFAFNPSFTGGVYVAVGDVNGDGFGDIIVGADAGGGPEVKVFSGRDGSVLMDFFAYNINFTGGVRVAAGDVNGDGFSDIITGAGPGGGPNVTVFSGATGAVLNSFFAYSPAFTGGVYVAAGAFGPNPLGPDDIVTGPGFGGGPNVVVYDGMTGAVLQSFLAEPVGTFVFGPNAGLGMSGVRVGTLNVDGNGASIVTSFGRGHQAKVDVFDFASGTQIDSFFAYSPLFTGGVYVGVGSL